MPLELPPALPLPPFLAALPWHFDAETLPADAGAYGVLIVLEQATALPSRLASVSLDAGTYVYLGSAHGSGGMRARCRRHLRRNKKRLWHADWLTSQARMLAVLAFPGGNECALTAAALAAGARSPVPGLGSSDCTGCPSHLVTLPVRRPRWPEAISP